MRIHNLYADADGESHFRDIEVQWVQDLPGGKLSERRPATGVIFRETAGDYDLDWHPAPRRQYIVNLDASVEITASDGERRVIGAGEVLLEGSCRLPAFRYLSAPPSWPRGLQLAAHPSKTHA